MNICITGPLGHIGSKFIRNLAISDLNKVYLVDNFATQRYASLFELPSQIKYHFHEMDILSDAIEPIISDSDILVHLAAITNAETSFNDPEKVHRVNRGGVEKVARLCAKHHCRMIFPSTTSVYGSQESLVDENCLDLKPQSPYADSKLAAEKFLQNLAKEQEFNFVILRLGTIFGYSIGMRFHTAVNRFTWQAVTGQDITVWKTALNQKRPYCGLNDCISALNHVIDTNIFDREVYNVVTVNLTVKNIIDLIAKFIPDISVKFVDSAIMNQLSYNVCNKKSLEGGFSYNDKLQDCILETIEKLKNICQR